PLIEHVIRIGISYQFDQTCLWRDGFDEGRRRIVAPPVQKVQGSQWQRLSLKAEVILSQIEVLLVPVRSERWQRVSRSEERLNGFSPQTAQRVPGLYQQ